MCEKCIEIDKQIARYRRLKANISSQRMEEAAMRLLADLELRRIGLHPPEKRPGAQFELFGAGRFWKVKKVATLAQTAHAPEPALRYRQSVWANLYEKYFGLFVVMCGLLPVVFVIVALFMR